MSEFNPAELQEAPNGALTADTRGRLIAIRNRAGMSYAALGSELGLSGPFVHSLLNKNARVGTQHIERIAKAIDRLERPAEIDENPKAKVTFLDHKFHLRPDLQISLNLPADLNQNEAQRLAQFIQSLPVY